MPKLRNGSSDIEQFTQWLGRKCRNHNPLSELGLVASTRAAQPCMYKAAAASQKEVFLVDATDRNKLVYMAAGRAFEITVNEIDPAEVAEVPKIAVGM